MNHINKCIYEKELEWNGIVNNKAWSRVLNKKRCDFLKLIDKERDFEHLKKISVVDIKSEFSNRKLKR